MTCDFWSGVRDLPLDVVSLESDALFVASGEIDTLSPVGSVDDVVVDEPVGGEAEGVKRREGERATGDTVAIGNRRSSGKL